MRVLVTGGARRIGAAISRALAADGWHVIIHHNSSGDEAARLATDIALQGGIAHPIAADLSDRDAAAALVPACITKFGRLEALINNASSFRYDTIDTMDAASWNAHVRPNLEAPIVLAQAFARQNRPGNIINLLDHKVTAPNPDFFSYTVAKMALAGVTRLLAQALAANAIRVNGVAPGITLLSGQQTEAGFARAWQAPPLGRSSTPQELAGACRYILTTPPLNGQILVLDGGESLLARPRDIAFDMARSP